MVSGPLTAEAVLGIATKFHSCRETGEIWDM